MRGDTDDPGSVHVSPVHIYPHVHVISPAEGSHSAGAAGAVISGVSAREAAAVPATARAAAAVGRVSVVRFVHPRAQHAALLHVAEDLIYAEADGLHVRVLLQMGPQYPYVIHGLREPHAPARGTQVAPRAAPWALCCLGFLLLELCSLSSERGRKRVRLCVCARAEERGWTLPP